ncbi:hypothetical protein G7054_g4435 [Neopestalotiopsis clavispora]|nr:hypothetical protein G7054_g4435 [Neopestalotiopsis clavispora]
MSRHFTSYALYDRLTTEFTLTNTPLLASAGLWMHFFYLAHDSTFSITIGRAAARYDNHFYLRGCSSAYALWSVLEIFCIYHAVKHRKLNFRDALGADSASLPVVLRYTVFMTAAMYCVVNLGVELMGGPGCIMQWGCLTNVLMVVGPTHDSVRRGSKDGLAVGFSVVNVFCVILTFAPFGMWVQVFPEIFDSRVYYTIGCILFVYSLWLLSIVAAYPAKPVKVAATNDSPNSVKAK